jgi:type II secretory pathway pseudopilin PulG
VPFPPAPPRTSAERGLTLLEVVIALLLFALMAIFLLSGHARAADAVLRMQVEREMAELLRLRLNLAALQFDEYREGTTEGDFPANVSSRLLDEDKALGDRFAGYRWEVTITPMLGAGASGSVEVEGDQTYEPLFAEESRDTAAGEDEGGQAAVVQPEEIDRMLFVQVTVYPPGYDPADESENALRPRSAWTAAILPQEEQETEAAGR